MKLNHLNLVVTDVAAASAFFENYFDFRQTATKGDNIISVLQGEGGFTLVVMAARDVAMPYPSAFHIGFMQENRAAVLDIYSKLKEGGIEVGREPQNIRDGYGFYFHFDGILIEIGLAENQEPRVYGN